jgi:acyl-CoA synthetase (NDP forming)/GNAT superfamily N-acetyltransferase
VNQILNVLAPADVLLADGTIAVVRPLMADDGPAVHDLHDRVSDEAIRLRFFTTGRHAAHSYVDHVLASGELGGRETIALVAERQGALIGLGTAEPINEHRCEVAFLVADEARGLGVGTLLLEHLAALALSRGVTQFEADVLAENHAMLSVFADAGFVLSRTNDLNTVLLSLGTTATDEVMARVDDREFQAESRSLVRLLHPHSVAVVGARSDGTGIGATVLRSITAGGFTGTVAAVHPRATSVAGVPAHPTVGLVPGQVDLVVVCVPAPAVDAVLRDAAAAGVQAAIVVSSGFGELGAEGARLQSQISTTARALGVRLVGPNCLGLLLNDPGIRLNATFQDAVPPVGGLAIASQSGGVGIVLVDLARELRLGVHTFVSLGNKGDVSSNDLLAAWYDDPDVTAAALYLESFGNAAKFARFARRFAERKPLMAVVGGRSASGSRAGASHTAAAATPGVGVDALFAQAGVIACRDAEDLARTAVLLTEQPLPRGRRLAIVSNAGGMGVLAADAAAEAGLDVVEFSSALQTRLAALVRGTTGTSNPVDAGAGVPPAEFGAMLDAVLASGEADSVLVVPVGTGVTDGTATMAELGLARAQYSDIPVVAVPLGGLPAAQDSEHPITCYRTTSSAVVALGRAARYAAWLAVERSSPTRSDPDDVVRLRNRARGLLEGLPGGGWLSPEDLGDLLGGYGITLLGETAVSGTAAAALAAHLGFPVAMKVADPDVVHKTDRGLVRIGLRTRTEVREVYRAFTRELGHPPEVLVQPMAAGAEVALGLVRDPALGPLVMVAAGGVATDVWDDRAFLVPPLSHADAARAVRSLRLWPLLDGFRGSAPADVAGLEHMLEALGRLAVDLPEVAELDLNPVLVGPDGCVVVDAKLRLAAPVGPDGSSPRQLRPVGS